MTGLPHVTEKPAPERTRQSDAAVLITGAGGEVGHGLVAALHGAGRQRIVALDLRELEAGQRELCRTAYVGDIRDRDLLREIISRHEIDEIHHLAAVLSTKAERDPILAHEVNVDGTANMLLLAAEQAERTGRPMTFIFPSSIAVYGLPDRDVKRRAGRVREDEHLAPRTIYGCHKLFAEHLGRNLARRGVDFRSLRFPGLISAHTLPSGGTSDFAPEMVHAAARHEHYRCFVRPDTRIPFMAMPDAVEATLRLAAADADRLTTRIYNLAAFSPSAEELAARLRSSVGTIDVTYEPDLQRQAIVDSWPQDVDDTAARREWGFEPRYDLDRAIEEYLLPPLRSA